MSERQASNGGTKRQAAFDEQSGLTPFLNGMAVDSPRAKTPKLSAVSSPRSLPAAVVCMPTPLQLSGSAAEDQECTMRSASSGSESGSESESESSDEDGLAGMLAFHQQNRGGRSASKTPAAKPTTRVLEVTPEAPQEDDGWATVKSEKKRSDKKPREIPDDAYVDNHWSDDEEDWECVRDMAKSGAGSVGKGKHGNSFKVSQARNMAISKRNAQRENSYR